MASITSVLAAVKFDQNGLVPAIAQAKDSGEVLMMAWMNAASIEETLTTGRVCYWSRSRQGFWRKGETSGHVQSLVEMRLDCDGDTLLLVVEQMGAACHTGARTCFYRKADAQTGLTAADTYIPCPTDHDHHHG